MVTIKEYAKISKCTPQNISRKIRTYRSIEDKKKAKRYFQKCFPNATEIVVMNYHCIMIKLRKRVA